MWNNVDCVGITWKTHRVTWNDMESHRVAWNNMERHGIAWNNLE